MFSRRAFTLSGAALLGLSSCQSAKHGQTSAPHIDVRDQALNDVLDPNASLDLLETGFGWSEGPTWDRQRERLYFTDVPNNIAFQWPRAGPVSVFLDPSGTSNAHGFREPGSNGLWYSRQGDLIVCNHGLRRVERLDLDTHTRLPIAVDYQGRRFNGPNEVVEASDGTLYFTDPPYGLEGLNASPLKEMSVNGVYRVRPDGQVERLVSDMTFPNGVALSPDERTLYVSQSAPNAPIIRALDLALDGSVAAHRTFFDASSLMNPSDPHMVDGMAVSGSGHIFATGPGGVLVLTPNGQLLGRILTGRATANCAFGEDGRTLFITAHDRLLRIRSKARGVQWT